jgi:hypothetical protein
MFGALLVVAILFSLSSTPAVSADSSLLSVCQLLKQTDRYAETTILLEGQVIADHHSVVLFSPMCQGGVYLSHEYGRSGDEWPAFDDALVRKSSGLETAPLRVKVRGIYHPRLKDGERTIRQLEVIQVLAVTLLAK